MNDTDAIRSAGSGDAGPSDADVRAALEAVTNSEGFTASPRLQQFLGYIVGEALDGRGASIRGKSIAVEVYGRSLDTSETGQNLVRVEARRLRRQLTEYYEGPGRNDPVRIEVAPGGYVPTFQHHAHPRPAIEPTPPTSAGRLLPFALAGLVAAGIAVAGWLAIPEPEPSVSADGARMSEAVRSALRERSLPSLQAANMAEQARGMFFPVYDAKRQALAHELFLHAIDLDPSLSDGYAGAAQTKASLAILTADPAQSAQHAAKAHELADQALELAPKDAWAHGAKAWALAASADHDDAVRFARLAVDLAPEDGHVLDLAGIAQLIAQNPEEAAHVSDPDRPRIGGGRFGARNVWGVSQIALGNYQAAARSFEGAIASGDPVSPPSLIFLSHAYAQLGQSAKAKELVTELVRISPDFPARFLVTRVFPEGSTEERKIMETLQEFGFGAGGDARGSGQ